MKRDTSIQWNRVDASSLDLKGWQAAVVGGTGGLGRAISRVLAARGAKVIVVGQTFRDADIPGLEFMQADLSSMREAERIGLALPAGDLDLVVFTTGIFAAPQRQETAEGIERDMAVSYLSRLVILRALAPRLVNRRAGGLKPRVFVMGFPGTGQAGSPDDLNAEKAYAAMPVHMNTVAGNEALVLDSVERYPQIAVFGLNPGLVKTNIRDNFFGKNTLKSRISEWLIGLATPTPEAFAERIAPLLVSADLDPYSGAMFNRQGNAIRPSERLVDASYRRSLIGAAETLVARVNVLVG